MASLNEILKRISSGEKPPERPPAARKPAPGAPSSRRTADRKNSGYRVSSHPTVIVDDVVTQTADEWLEAIDSRGGEPDDSGNSNAIDSDVVGDATVDSATAGEEDDPFAVGSDEESGEQPAGEQPDASSQADGTDSSAGSSPDSSPSAPLVSDKVRLCHECGNPISVGDIYHRKPVPLHPGAKFPVFVDAHPGCMGEKPSEESAKEEQKSQPAKPPQNVDLSEIEAELSRIRAKLSTLEASGKALHSDVAKSVKSLNAKIEALKAVQRVEVVIKTPDRELLTLEDEFLHPAYSEVLDLVCDREEVFLPGPAGCGKTHMAQQVAAAFAKFVGLPATRFESLSCSGGVTESSFFGRLVPSENTPEKAIDRFDSLIAAGMNEQAAASAMGADAGAFRYQSTPFLEMYEHGGVFLLDEVDACDPNVLVAVNSALSNGWVNIAARPINSRAVRHVDFVCIAAANTFGRGADRLYVGRTQLDESTLDRFRFGVVPMDYAEELERRLLPIDSLRQRLVGYRRKMIDAKLERVCSTRFMAKTHRAYQRFKASGRLHGHKTFEDYVDAKLFAGWSDKEIITVRGSRLPAVKA